jgi:DeoR family ulaG and ulaABCDEF operon transcriptional repressor
MISSGSGHRYYRTMIASQRHHRMLTALGERGFLNLQQLVDLVDASEATIRRDLRDLQKAGRLERVRGGARACQIPGIAKPDHPYHRAPNLPAKRRIAALASSLCNEREQVILDGGSTVYQMVPHLVGKQLSILTNSFPIAEYLLKHSTNQVIVPGGIVDPQHWVILNPFDDEIRNKYAAQTVFMSAEGYDSLGFNNDRDDIIRMQRSMIRIAKRLVLLLDSSKFQHRGTLRLCTFDEVDMVITDDSIGGDHRRRLEDQGISVLVA